MSLMLYARKALLGAVPSQDAASHAKNGLGVDLVGDAQAGPNGVGKLLWYWPIASAWSVTLIDDSGPFRRR